MRLETDYSGTAFRRRLRKAFPRCAIGVWQNPVVREGCLLAERVLCLVGSCLQGQTCWCWEAVLPIGMRSGPSSYVVDLFGMGARMVASRPVLLVSSPGGADKSEDGSKL